MKTNCTICRTLTATENLPIYVIGSEGLNVCHSCKMTITHYIQDMMHIAGKVYIQAKKESK